MEEAVATCPVCNSPLQIGLTRYVYQTYMVRRVWQRTTDPDQKYYEMDWNKMADDDYGDFDESARIQCENGHDLDEYVTWNDCAPTFATDEWVALPNHIDESFEG